MRRINTENAIRITDAAAELVRVANQCGDECCTAFNQIDLVASPGADAPSVIDAWDKAYAEAWEHRRRQKATSEAKERPATCELLTLLQEAESTDDTFCKPISHGLRLIANYSQSQWAEFVARGGDADWLKYLADEIARLLPNALKEFDMLVCECGHVFDAEHMERDRTRVTSCQLCGHRATDEAPQS